MFDSPTVRYPVVNHGITTLDGVKYTWEQVMMMRQLEALEAIQKQLAELLEIAKPFAR